MLFLIRSDVFVDFIVKFKLMHVIPSLVNKKKIKLIFRFSGHVDSLLKMLTGLKAGI